ncbi:hypothetical protein PG985_001653 [Apiospora marii]|uniref:uncharacterized protein n=1 Tax=Apiospora marii TaxID=335849 RepID=UPI00313088B2
MARCYAFHVLDWLRFVLGNADRSSQLVLACKYESTLAAAGPRAPRMRSIVTGLLHPGCDGAAWLMMIHPAGEQLNRQHQQAPGLAPGVGKRSPSQKAPCQPFRPSHRMSMSMPLSSVEYVRPKAAWYIRLTPTLPFVNLDRDRQCLRNRQSISPHAAAIKPCKEISANPRALVCHCRRSVIDCYYTISPFSIPSLEPLPICPTAKLPRPKPDRPISEGLSFPDPCCPARERVSARLQVCSSELPSIIAALPFEPKFPKTLGPT